MQPLNYASAAIADIKDYKKSLLNLGYNKSALLCELVIHGLINSQKFILPDGGKLFDRSDIDQKDIDLLRMPYPIVCAEFSAQEEPPSAKIEWVKTSKRIALAFSMNENDLATMPANFARELAADRLPSLADGGVFIIPINFCDKIGKWVPNWVGVWISYGATVYAADSETKKREQFKEMAGRLKDVGIILSGKVVTGTMVFLFGEIGEMAMQASGGDFDFNVAIDTHAEKTAIMQLCAALNCSNVSTETLPAPKFLNKKRAKSGKPPLFEYKILKVDTTPTATRQSIPGGGTHASPRVHLRRGHIRRLPVKSVWVQPCVVGDKSRGVVMKDYAVTRRGGE